MKKLMPNRDETPQEDGSGDWRWNVNTTWHNFSSLCQECQMVLESPNEFLKYHHLRAALYFGLGSIESFLNQAMRGHLQKAGKPEEVIFKKLRRTGLKDKMTKWPTELAISEVEIPTKVISTISKCRDIRDEVTHPKNRDHSIYRELDDLSVGNLNTTVGEFIVLVLQGRGEVFPYWLLSWNFIGMGSDRNHPCFLDNQQFIFALSHLGFEFNVNEPTIGERWQRDNMSSLGGYKDLGKRLASFGRCERKDSRFPYLPRLCNRWWDSNHMQRCGD